MPTIKLEHIGKIEGHAKLVLCIEDHTVRKLNLEIFEGARFFENILKGKKYDELPLITSRICGVCSPAHTLCSIQAIEDAFNISPSQETKLLRELLALGGLIQSHILHLYFLALPDYLGYDSALQMTQTHKKDIELALRIKGIGNRIVTAVGGRDIHPLTTVVGGFSKIPAKRDLEALLKILKTSQDDIFQCLELFSNLQFPDFQHHSTYFSFHGTELLGKDIGFLEDGTLSHYPHDYETYMHKFFQHDSTAEFVVIKERSYTVGAQARMNINWDLQDKDLQVFIQEKAPFTSPFSNIPLQGFEVASAVKRAQEILMKLLDRPLKDLVPESIPSKASTGIGVVEAPRGLLFHKYAFDENGFCTRANVTTPTSQNLKTIEEGLQEFVSSQLHLSEKELIAEMEKLIRAYDPCISCSSH